MRVFVYEYLSSGAAGDISAFPSLQREGWAMLSAVREDLARCPGIETSTLVRIPDPSTEEDFFRNLAAAADFSLVIAPEFKELLEKRCRWVEEAGGRLLGPSPAAIRLTADKLTLACHWQRHGIPTPPTIEFVSNFSPEPLAYPIVAKPRYGAGSQATFLLHNENELARAVRQTEAEGWSGSLLLQTYSPGIAVSVTFLAGEETRYVLPAVEQCLSSEGRFHYRGGRLPLSPDLDHRARRLAERATACVEGLRGWYGIDLVLGIAEDGSGDRAIEINPRLTTSYLGLRKLALFNLMEALLAVAAGSSAPPWVWQTDPIVFGTE